MQFAPSLGIGILAGLANGWLWRISGRWLLGKKGLFIIFKLGLLALSLWVLLNIFAVDPIGLLAGFSAMMIWVLKGMLKWS